MKWTKSIVAILLLVTLSMQGQIADESPFSDTRVWYSTYVKKKINYRWSIDNHNLLALRSFKHDYWLTQFTIGANYRINRFWTLSFGYGHSLYQYGPFWERRYDQGPGVFNTIGFHNFNLSIRRDSKFGKWLKVSNRLILQYYIPRFEKYQLRPQYNLRIGYRRSNLPLRLRPFIQGQLYYYFNGIPVDYYDDELEFVEEASPNGFHRMRVRIGTTLRPIKKFKPFSMTLYYGLNKEFNLGGNDLNITTPSVVNEGSTFTRYRFNDYTIAGVQFNFFL